MNLAELTANLAKKDGEKSMISDALQTLKDMDAKGYQKVIAVTVLDLLGDDSNNGTQELSFQLLDKASEPSGVPSVRNSNEQIRLPLKECDSVLQITCLLKSPPATEPETDLVVCPSGLQPYYKCELDISLLPETGEFRTDLEGFWIIDESSRTSESPFCRVKVSKESIQDAIADRSAEALSLEQEIRELKKSVQQVSSEDSTSSKKKKKTTKKKTSGGTQNASAIPSTNSTSAASFLVNDAIAFCADQHSILLFSIAALTIFFVGDYASI